MAQLRLCFSDNDDALETSEATPPLDVPTAEDEIERVAQLLRPKILSYLHAIESEAALRELRQVLGYAADAYKRDPVAHPVDRIVQQMCDAKELETEEIGWGEPVFFLAAPDQPESIVTDSPSTINSTHCSEVEFPCTRDPAAMKRSSRMSLVRADRQFTFDGRPPDEWPRPPLDRHTISVDRIRNDIDGPPHRFHIERGDHVEVFLSPEMLTTGTVVQVSHVDQQVRVRLDDDSTTNWYPVEQVYPTVESESSLPVLPL